MKFWGILGYPWYPSSVLPEYESKKFPIFEPFFPIVHWWDPKAEALKLRLGENTVIRDRPLNITTKHKTFQTRTFSRLWKFIAVFTFGYCLHLWFLQYDKTKKIKDSHFIVINARFSYKSQVKMVHKNISTTIITENFEDKLRTRRKFPIENQIEKCTNPFEQFEAFLRIFFFICFWASHLHSK